MNNSRLKLSFITLWNQPIFRIAIYVFFSVLSVLSPILIWQLNSPLLSFTLNKNHQIFELFGCFISIELIAIAYLELNQYEIKHLKRIILIILPLLTSLLFLFLILEYSYDKSGDYIAYEGASNAIIQGINPYSKDSFRPYIYPPLLAQIMAFLYGTYNKFFLNNFTNDNKDGLIIVFYLYQCVNFFLLLLAYFLCYSIAKTLGLKQLAALLIVSGLFIFNNPLIRTLRWHQVNCVIFDSFLLGMVMLQRYPWISGASIAIGIHIKLYPAIMFIPWFITRKWRACTAVIVIFIAILSLQTNFGKNMKQWQYFIDYFTEDVQKPLSFRNNSLNSLIHNLFTFAGLPSFWYGKILFMLTFSFCLWFLLRFIQREKYYRSLLDNMADPEDNKWSDIYRSYGHSMDAIAFSLLISPSVWEHHYIVTIPIAIFVLATQRRNRVWQIVLGILLIFWLPTFDIFILSYHRLLGLIILLYLSNPAVVYDYFKNHPKNLSSRSPHPKLQN